MNRLRHKLLLLVRAGLALAALASPARAQHDPLGSSTLGQAEEYLDIGNVRARVSNGGWLFFGDGGYEIPQGSGAHALANADFLVSGIVRDSLRIAGGLAIRRDFWPGPLSVTGSPPADCADYDRIWRVEWDDVRVADATGVITNQIRDWPYELGAPVIDGNGIAGDYSPAEGDRPSVLGDQMAWWVMNDRGNAHSYYDTAPLGIEVRATAFAFGGSGTLPKSTFYRYDVTNRRDEAISGAYLSFFMQPELGYFDDDLVGSDTTLGIAFMYNADNDDEGHYGLAPPALGVTVIKGPAHSLAEAGGCTTIPGPKRASRM